MAKRIPHKRKVETVALPTADNAKWLAFGFLAALGLFLLSIALLITSHIH